MSCTCIFVDNFDLKIILGSNNFLPNKTRKSKLRSCWQRKEFGYFRLRSVNFHWWQCPFKFLLEVEFLWKLKIYIFASTEEKIIEINFICFFINVILTIFGKHLIFDWLDIKVLLSDNFQLTSNELFMSFLLKLIAEITVIIDSSKVIKSG